MGHYPVGKLADGSPPEPRQIKGELGMVMVQDEDSAKYAGMPRSAAATGLVDYVPPADKMPKAIKYTRYALSNPGT